MFGIGPFELVLVIVVVIVIYGPKQLPQVMKQAARFLVQARRYSNDMRGQFQDVMQQVEKEIAHEELEKLRKELRNVTPSLDANPTTAYTQSPASDSKDLNASADSASDAEQAPLPNNFESPPPADPMSGSISSEHNPKKSLFDHAESNLEPLAVDPSKTETTEAPSKSDK